MCERITGVFAIKWFPTGKLWRVESNRWELNSNDTQHD